MNERVSVSWCSAPWHAQQQQQQQHQEEVEVTVFDERHRVPAVGGGITPPLYPGGGEEASGVGSVGTADSGALLRDLTTPQPTAQQWRSAPPPLWLQLSYFVAVIFFLLYFLVDSLTSRKLYRQLERLFQWIEDHPVEGPVVFFCAVVVFALICVPESVLTIGGGYIFGRAHGVALGMLLCTSIVFLGAMAGSIIAFLVARHLIQGTVQGWAHHFRVLRAIDRSLVENGRKMVFLLRLSPILPFYILNYVMGATLVSTQDFALGSFGMLPWIIVCAYLGNALGGIQDVSLRHIPTSNRILTITCYSVGGAATLGVLYILMFYTRRAFNEVLEAEARGRAFEDVVADNRGEDRGASNSEAAGIDHARPPSLVHGSFSPT